MVFALLKSSHSKIGDSNVHVFRQENVLRLEVAMANVELVAVRDGTQHLPEVLHRFGLRQAFAVDDVFEELAVVGIFEHEISGN